MNEKINLKQIYKLNGDDVIVIGLSKVKPLAKMQELGCLGTGKFKPLQVISADDSIKKERIIIFSRGKELYHNRATVDNDVVIYKSLNDVAGARCITLEKFKECVATPESNLEEFNG